MSLRIKMLLVQGMFLVGAIALVVSMVYFVILAGFKQVEQEQARKDVHRVSLAFDAMMVRLSSSASDYALWDDTFNRFNNIDSETYDLDNLSQDVLNNLDVDVFALITYSGEVLNYVTRSEEDEESEGSMDDGQKGAEIMQTIAAYLASNSTVLEVAGTSGECKGLIPLNNYPLVAAMRPVTKTDGSGTSPGVTFFGKFLNDDRIAALGELTQTSLSYVRLDTGIPTDETRSVLSAISTSTPETLRVISSDELAGYFKVSDMAESALIMVRVSMSRNAYLLGRQTIVFFLGIASTLGLLLLGLILSRFQNETNLCYNGACPDH